MQQTTSKPIFESRRNRAAFTLVELLVVVVVLTLLAMCLLPALAHTKPDTRAFQCLNNHRQLARAWRMYADDSNDKLIGIVHGTSLTINDPRRPWVQGWLDWNTRNDNTNQVFLTDPRYAALAIYCGKDAGLFQCPTDQFVSSIQRNRGWKQRVRSVSGNVYVGGTDVETGPADPAFAVARKWTDLSSPKPAETWVFMDEHPDSINDPAMFPPSAMQWLDLPGNLHDGGAGVAFADGSAEVHRWQGSALNFRVRFVPVLGSGVPNDPDIAWLRAHTPRKPGAN